MARRALPRRKRKALGQHFLRNFRVLRKILFEIDPHPDELVVEIGAGKGVLTFPLAKKAGKVVAIEKDRSLLPFLQKIIFPNLEILGEDVLKVHLKKIIEANPNFKGQAKLVGNLPYSISSPLLFKLLEEREVFKKCVFCLQKEVAERVCAQAGSKKYAPLSIMVQLYFSARLLFVIPPLAFSPPPQVESALISLEKRAFPLFPIQNESRFLKFLQDAFRHRRKILLNNLEKSNFSPALIQDAYQKYDLERNVRAEELSLSQFVHLFDFFSAFPKNAI